MDRTSELKARVEAKRKQIEANLAKAKADAKGKANEAIAAMEKQLTSLKGHLTEGWDRVSAATTAKLNEWLKR